MDDIVILGGARTPTGRFLGGLSKTPAPELAAVAIRGALRRAGVDAGEVDEVILGQVLSAGAGQAPARQAAIKAGVPVTASAFSVNKVCASGLEAVILAAQRISTGSAEVVAAGGMENMSLAPHLLANSRTGTKLGAVEMIDSAVHDGLWCAWECRHMGDSAEEIARKYGIDREEQDSFALESHRKAVAAMDGGGFQSEIEPVQVRQKGGPAALDADETPRRDTSRDALARLAAAFQEGGTVTAGNAPGLCDGASALVVTSAATASRRAWTARARITGWANANLEPRWLFDAPPEAVTRLLERTGMALSDFDLIEVNEAFSAQVLANGKVLGWDWDRVNVKGGAVALGHPIGASGARILVTLLHALEERGLARGLAVLCHGGGGAVALSIERIAQ
jgi:acetyl-CoA C-acetyltransferase